jgi:hypothetical protein
MSTVTEGRLESIVTVIENDSLIFNQFLTGNEDVEIPVEGGTLLSLLNIQKKLLSAELDANNFVSQIADEMNNVTNPSEE